ncbi:hypothetical protein Adt_44961 [Abeliophyllum distichum]|uniref:Uncharacterized protein n=1 Tax=Abeliophyllum distichum TaxID=126358 RepID=A0ABD1PCD7_9LAMI
MLSRNDDSQNQSDDRTNPSIRGESPSSASSSSSSEIVGKVNQAPSVARPSTPSTSGRGACPTVRSKEIAEKRGPDVEVPEMRGSLDKKDAPTTKALDEELRRSATEVFMAHSKISKGELEDMRLSYDILASVILRAPGPEERADEPPEGFVAI